MTLYVQLEMKVKILYKHDSETMVPYKMVKNAICIIILFIL